jgi:hypothetical protein
MSIRIYRNWYYTHVYKDNSIGGKFEYVLVHTDELQFLDGNTWVPVPIVESEKPEHPDIAKYRRIGEEVDKFLKNRNEAKKDNSQN